jgi:hypothetical protein
VDETMKAAAGIFLLASVSIMLLGGNYMIQDMTDQAHENLNTTGELDNSSISAADQTSQTTMAFLGMSPYLFLLLVIIAIFGMLWAVL